MGAIMITGIDGDDLSFKGGGNFDPKNFKGNVDLVSHLCEDFHSKWKHKFEPSASIKQRKMKKKTARDDYNMLLPADEIKNVDNFDANHE